MKRKETAEERRRREEAEDTAALQQILNSKTILSAMIKYGGKGES